MEIGEGYITPMFAGTEARFAELRTLKELGVTNSSVGVLDWKQFLDRSRIINVEVLGKRMVDIALARSMGYEREDIGRRTDEVSSANGRKFRLALQAEAVAYANRVVEGVAKVHRTPMEDEAWNTAINNGFTDAVDEAFRDEIGGSLDTKSIRQTIRGVAHLRNVEMILREDRRSRDQGIKYISFTTNPFEYQINDRRVAGALEAAGYCLGKSITPHFFDQVVDKASRLVITPSVASDAGIV
jgi:hypothetical protein